MSNLSLPSSYQLETSQSLAQPMVEKSLTATQKKQSQFSMVWLKEIDGERDRLLARSGQTHLIFEMPTVKGFQPFSIYAYKIMESLLCKASII